MSLAETQEIMQLLQEIMAMLDGIDVATAKLESDLPQTKQAVATKRDLLRLVMKLNLILRQMGFPKEIEGVITKVQQAIFFVNALTIAMMAFERSTLIGNVLGVVGVAATIVSASSLEGY